MMRGRFVWLGLLCTAATLPMSAQVIYISADMEGVAGLSSTDDPLGRRLMTEEVNAAIAGAFDGGAARVIVNDAHGSHANLIQTDLDPRVTLIRGNLKPYGMVQGLTREMAAAVFIGYHGRAGSTGSFAAHTGSGAVADLTVNDRSVGEGGINALFAAWHGVPVVFVSGDRVAVEQLQAIAPGAEGVAVKTGIWNRAVESISPEAARAAIREGVAHAIRTPAQATRPVGPFRITLSYTDALLADIAEGIPGVDRVDHRTVAFTTGDYPEAYRMIRVLYKHLRP